MRANPSAKSRRVPAEPWASFLRALDELLQGAVDLHCLGGFVVTQQYGIGRETSDIDFLSAVARSREDDVEALAGLGSALHRKYRVYLQYVGVATPPCNYATRLQPMFPDESWKRLLLLALDPTDIALSKLERNADRDREDVLRLARAGLVGAQTLRARYFDEVRPHLLSRQSWHDQTLDLWLEMISPASS
jgi:Nucleotidyltransferase of unknown function (DUF6036)